MRKLLMSATLALAIAGELVGVGLTSSASTVVTAPISSGVAQPRVSTFNHLSSGSHALTLNVGGLQRSFIVEVPSNKPVANRALVLVYHGADDTAVATIGETNLLQEVTARHDVIAFLQGYKDTWNEGSGTTPSSLAHVNDVAYSSAVIARLRQLVSFDPSHVAAVGFSNGAIMVEDLGCKLASLISLIVPVEGQMSTVQSASCLSPRSMSVYEIHGTGDTTIPYNGGYFSTSIGEDTMLSAPNSVARWAHLEGCAAGPAASTPSSGITLSTYSKCRSGASVVLRTIAGGQHAWPSDIGQLVVQELAHFPQ